MSVAPDLAAPIEAWRTWLVVRAQDGLRLASVMYPVCWPHREHLVASCRPQHQSGWPGLVDARLRSHESPATACRCGVYGAQQLGEAARYLEPVGPVGEPVAWSVIGRVALWGNVVEATAGYRASHAYPAAIYVPARRLFQARVSRALPERFDADAIADALCAYGVPIRVLSSTTPLEVAADLQLAA